jgi:hypothetical protein
MVFVVIHTIIYILLHTYNIIIYPLNLEALDLALVLVLVYTII